MYHLFRSAVRVLRLQLTVVDGIPSMEWVQATDPDDPHANDMLQYLECRIDMNFLRPGKDILPAPEAGKAPDRVGILFTYPYAPIRAGDRLVAIPNDEGKTIVPGVFEIRLIPDEAVDFSDQHHLEVQIIETNQTLTTENWPTEAPLVDSPGEDEDDQDPIEPDPDPIEPDPEVPDP